MSDRSGRLFGDGHFKEAIIFFYWGNIILPQRDYRLTYVKRNVASTKISCGTWVAFSISFRLSQHCDIITFSHFLVTRVKLIVWLFVWQVSDLIAIESGGSNRYFFSENIQKSGIFNWYNQTMIIRHQNAQKKSHTLISVLI